MEPKFKFSLTQLLIVVALITFIALFLIKTQIGKQAEQTELPQPSPKLHFQELKVSE